MASIKVTSEELHTQSQRVGSGASQVSDILGQLTSQVQDLASRWEGSASGSFQSMWQDWQHGATQVQEAMAGIGRLLQQAAVTYESAEEQIQRSTGH